MAADEMSVCVKCGTIHWLSNAMCMKCTYAEIEERKKREAANDE